MLTKATRASPIIRAAAVEAVRRGLRMAFWRARVPGSRNALANGQPMSRASGRAISGLRMATPKNTITAPEADVDQPVALVLEQAGQQRGHADEGDQHAEHDPALAEAGRGERRLRLEGGHRRHPGRLEGRQQRRQHGHDDADQQRHDHRAGLELDAGGGDVGAEDRAEQGLEAAGDQHAEAEADQRGHHGDDQRLEQHRGHHLAAAGPQAAQQGQLAGALGDDDGEGVEDQERAHQQGHEGEGEQRRAQEPADGVVDRRRPGPRPAPRR